MWAGAPAGLGRRQGKQTVPTVMEVSIKCSNCVRDCCRASMHAGARVAQQARGGEAAPVLPALAWREGMEGSIQQRLSVGRPASAGNDDLQGAEEGGMGRQCWPVGQAC